MIDVRLGVSGGAVIKEAGTEPVTESLALLLAPAAGFQPDGVGRVPRKGIEGIAAAMAADRATDRKISGSMKTLLHRSLDPCLAAGMFPPGGRSAKWTTESILPSPGACGNAVYQFVLQMVHGNIHSYFEDHPLKDERHHAGKFSGPCRDRSTAIGTAAGHCRTVTHAEPCPRRFNRYMIDQQSELRLVEET